MQKSIFLRAFLLPLVFWLPSKISAQTVDSRNSISIEVDYENNFDKDSLVLLLENKLYKSTDDMHHKTIPGTRTAQGTLQFLTKIEDSCGYLTIAKIVPEEKKKEYELMPVLNRYFWEKGDLVKIKITFPNSNNPEVPEFTFSGHGSDKYKARNSLFNMYLQLAPLVRLSKKDADTSIVFPNPNDIKKADSLLLVYSAMSRNSLNILKADLTFRGGYTRVISVINSKLNRIKRQELLREFEKVYPDFENITISKEVLASSLNFPRFYIDYLFARTLLRSGEKDLTNRHTGKKNPTEVFQTIIQEPNTPLRDQLLAAFFLENVSDNNISQQYAKALSLVQDKKCKNAIIELKSRYLGAALPRYSFLDEKNRNIKLSDFKGKVVLIDLWFSGCGGCAVLYKETMSKIEDQFYKHPGLAILSINVDKKISIWQQAISTGLYTSPDKAINLTTGPSGMRHPIVQDFALSGMPCLILINKAGNVEYFNTSNIREAKELSKVINGLL